MLNLSTTYPGNVDLSQLAVYPWGKPRNITSPGATDGTPWEAGIASDLAGVMQALLSAAGLTPNDVTERVGSCQVKDALDILYVNESQLTDEQLVSRKCTLVSEWQCAPQVPFPVDAGTALGAFRVQKGTSALLGGSEAEHYIIGYGYGSNTGQIMCLQVGPSAYTIRKAGAITWDLTTGGFSPLPYGATANACDMVVEGKPNSTAAQGIYGWNSNSATIATIGSTGTAYRLLGAGYHAQLGKFIALVANGAAVVPYTATTAAGTWTVGTGHTSGAAALAPLTRGAGTMQRPAMTVASVYSAPGAYATYEMYCLCREPSGSTVRLMHVNTAGACDTSWGVACGAVITYGDFCHIQGKHQGFGAVLTTNTMVSFSSNGGSQMTTSVSGNAIVCFRYCGTDLIGVRLATDGTWTLFKKDDHSVWLSGLRLPGCVVASYGQWDGAFSLMGFHDSNQQFPAPGASVNSSSALSWRYTPHQIGT